MPAFSVCVTVEDAEVCNVTSCCFFALIKRGVITHIGLTDRPANERAVITHRRDALPIDHSHDAVVAAIDRLRKGLEAFVGTVTAQQSEIFDSQKDDVKDLAPTGNSEASASPLRSLGAAPPLILGRLPAAILTPRRNDFRNLVARLPVGETP